MHVVPVAGGLPAEVCDGSSPVWLDDAELVVGVDRDDTTALARVNVDDPWPARLAVHAGDCISPVVSPARSQLAHLVFHRDDLNCTSLHVIDLARAGASRELVHDPATNVRSPAFTPDGTQIVFATERSGWYEVESVDLVTGTRREITRDRGEFDALQPTHDGHVVATRARNGVTDLVRVSLADGTVDGARGRWHVVVAAAAARRRRDRGARVVRHSRPACAAWPPTARCARSSTTRRRPVRAAPHVVPEHVTYRSTDGMEVHGWVYRPDWCVGRHAVPGGGAAPRRTDLAHR